MASACRHWETEPPEITPKCVPPAQWVGTNSFVSDLLASDCRPHPPFPPDPPTTCFFLVGRVFPYPPPWPDGETAAMPSASRPTKNCFPPPPANHPTDQPVEIYACPIKVRATF